MVANKFTVADLWESTAAKHAARPCLIFEGKTLTFKQVDDGTTRGSRAVYEGGPC